MSSSPISPEQLDALSPQAQALVRALIDHYERRIAELEAKLNKTPQNSSLPPSTQHPHAKPQPKKTGNQRKRGGQPGHAKYERPLLPSDQCDQVVTRRPTACRRCGQRLHGEDAQPLRHQVWELPDIKPHVTEYQQHRLHCESCKTTTCGELPAGVPSGQAGPRLALHALWLTIPHPREGGVMVFEAPSPVEFAAFR